MSMRYPGGFLAPSPVTANYPSGVWTQAQALPYQAQNVWTRDQFWPYTTLLLQGNGTNGAQNNTFLDSSSNNFTITRNGNATQGSFTPYEAEGYWSNYFDGVAGTYLSLPSNAAFDLGTGAYTVEFWCCFAGSATDQNLVEMRGLGGTGGQLRIAKNAANLNLGYGTGTGADTQISTAWPGVGVWMHIVAVRSGTTVSLFLNGQRVGTKADSTNLAQSALAIGTYSATAGMFNGNISNLRIIKGVAVYDPSLPALTVPAAPLTAVANTSVLTCQSNRYRDASTNNFAVSSNGGVSVQSFQPFSGATTYSGTVLGGSGYFGGSGNYLSVGYNAALELGTGDFTVEGMLYLPSSATYVDGQVSLICAGRQDVTLGGWNINAFDATGSCSLRLEKCLTNGTAVSFVWTISATAGIPRNTWIHFAVVRNSGTTTAYWNGASLGSTATFNGVDLPIPGSRSTFIAAGADATGPTRWPFTGFMSGVRIVKGTAVYTSNFTPPTAPLTAITNTSLLLNFTNGGIVDSAMVNDIETVGNAQVSTSVVKYGTGSMAFDGAGDWLTLAPSPNFQFGTGDFTIEGWIYLNTTASAFPIVYNTDSSSVLGAGEYAFIFNPTVGLRFVLNSNGTSFQIDLNQGSTSGWSAGTWYHVALVRSGSTFTLYRNGVSLASNTTANATVGALLPVYVGGQPLDPLSGNGYIDDLRITKGVARYITNFTPPPARMPGQ